MNVQKTSCNLFSKLLVLTSEFNKTVGYKIICKNQLHFYVQLETEIYKSMSIIIASKIRNT